ncbi:MAG: hypothetical protein II723_08025 [Oscillospiraceae bacterium]|nr:hypothetical protein [Oscillospiraceae bacterium]
MLNYVLMEEQLRGEYKSVFSHIYSDVITRNYQEDFLDDKMSDLFDLLVTAQSQNLPAERVTGSDPERFCREFFADYGLRERLRSVADRLKSVAWFLLVFELLSVSARIHALRDIFTVRTNIAPYGVGTAVGILLMLVSAFIRPAIWKSRRMSAGKWSGIICLVMVALIIAGTALFKDRELLVPAFPFILGSAAYLLVYYTVRSVCNYRRFGTLRNPHRALYRESQAAMQDSSLELITLRAWAKDYDRRLKKGKVTEESYLDHIRKLERVNSRGETVYTAFTVLFCAAAVWQVARESAVPDTLFFAALLIGLEYLIWRFFHKTTVRTMTICRKTIAACEKRGITAPAYIRERLSPAPELAAEEAPPAAGK